MDVTPYTLDSQCPASVPVTTAPASATYQPTYNKRGKGQESLDYAWEVEATTPRPPLPTTNRSRKEQIMFNDHEDCYADECVVPLEERLDNPCVVANV